MTRLEAPRENKIHLELPTPPHSQSHADEQTFIKKDVTVTLLNGKQIIGELYRFIAAESVIDLYHVSKHAIIKIKFTQIKSIKLTNLRSLLTSEDANTPEKTSNDNKQNYQIFDLTYTDGSVEKSNIIGYVLDEKGIHVFPTQTFRDYAHWFIPFTATINHSFRPFTDQHQTLNTTSTFDTDFGLTDLTENDDGFLLLTEEITNKEQLSTRLKHQRHAPNIKLGTALIQEGLITEGQLDEALDKQKIQPNIPLGEILSNDMGVVPKESITKTLATKLGIPYINLRKFSLEPAIIQLIPDTIATKHGIVPVCQYDSKLIIAMENPMDRVSLEDIKFHTEMFIEPVMASARDIKWALNTHYNASIDEFAKSLEDDAIASIDEDDDEPIVQETDNALVKLANKMIMDAYQQGVSDIHIEPYPGKNKTVIRFRKDGSIVPYVEVPPSYREALISRIKIMCQLDISERRKPQDGKINFSQFGPANIELRVATIPTTGGVEDVVMRVLANGEPVPLEKLRLSQPNLDGVLNLVKKPYGLFLVCGPTGSGKTTTLHSILGTLNTSDKKIWTAEDPVEITQRGLRQVQVNSKTNFTFANAMRAFLRADPDIIMVGEMRDKETTSTGIEASLTGHLVLSTLHTNSAVESITRLLDMGMDPFNFADALLGILAQRLAKCLCDHCAEKYLVTDEALIELAQEYYTDLFASSETNTTTTTDLPDNAKQNNAEQLIKDLILEWQQNYGDDQGDIYLKKPIGCDYCSDTGYHGRLGLHELLTASKPIKKLIQERASVAVITEAAFHEGMHSLKQDGIQKVLAGHTDMLQVRAVCIK